MFENDRPARGSQAGTVTFYKAHNESKVSRKNCDRQTQSATDAQRSDTVTCAYARAPCRNKHAVTSVLGLTDKQCLYVYVLYTAT